VPELIKGTSNGLPIQIKHINANNETAHAKIFEAAAGSSAKLVLFKWANLAGYELKAEFEDYQIKKIS